MDFAVDICWYASSMAGVPWNSLRDFAGFRGVERKPATGRLAVSLGGHGY